jgi:RHS repeat-associated protein
LNELTAGTWNGTLTVAGATTAAATNVTVNTSNAVLYADNTFAAANLPLANGNNTFTAVGRDAAGHVATNTVNVSVSANAFVYDLNGNLLNDGQRYFAYDDENELTSVTVSNAWRSEYVYDGKMRRRIDREYKWNAGAWQLAAATYYVYDGNLVLQERLGGNIPAVTYTRGNDLSGSLQGAGGIGGLLARTDNSTLNPQLSTSFYHADGNGNVTMLLDANQNVVAKYLYDPYGNTLAMSGQMASANTYRFSSKEWNANAGLYYYLYRFYDPNLQRWPNRDPLSEPGFEMLRHRHVVKYPRRFRTFAEFRKTPDLYEFVHNSPLSKIDLWGLDCLDDLVNCVNLIVPSERAVDVDWAPEDPQIFFALASGWVTGCYVNYAICLDQEAHPPPCPIGPPSNPYEGYTPVGDNIYAPNYDSWFQ